MKLDHLETHDRYLEFMKTAEMIDKGIEDCKRNLPDTITMPFYIFAHKRTVEMDEKISIWNQEMLIDPKYRRFKSFSDIPEKRIIYCPYPRRPKPQSNSWLVRTQKNTDTLELIWIIPEEELWDQFGKKMLLEDEFIFNCIQVFKNNPASLEYDQKELPIEKVDEFRMKIKECAEEIQKKKLVRPKTSAASLILPV